MDETAKKRLLEMQRIHDPGDFKSRLESRHLEMQKRRRKALLDLARESLVFADESKSMTVDSPHVAGADQTDFRTAKIALCQLMTKIPADLVPNWLVYAVPEGIECLVTTCNKRTMIKDKYGNNMEAVSTLLPSGNTILQGVYNKSSKTIYITDLFLWDNELLIENTAETRWSALTELCKRHKALGELGEENEVRFRLPLVAECSKTAFDGMYYGACVGKGQFAAEYERLVNYIRQRDLFLLIKVKEEEVSTSEGMTRVCGAFAVDSAGEFYLKDGIAFVHKQGLLSLGYSEVCVQWKDSLVSPHYDSLLSLPALADLFYDSSKNLVTHDGCVIDKLDPSIEGLKTNQVYRFTFEGIYLGEGSATLSGLKYQQALGNVEWHSIDYLVFRFLATRNMLSYKVLAQQLEMQQANPMS